MYHLDFITHAIPSPDFPGLSYSLMPNSLTGIVCHDGWDQKYPGRIDETFLTNWLGAEEEEIITNRRKSAQTQQENHASYLVVVL